MRFFVIINNLIARVAELVDALVLGTSVFDVRVRVSPFAPIYSLRVIVIHYNFIYRGNYASFSGSR